MSKKEQFLQGMNSILNNFVHYKDKFQFESREYVLNGLSKAYDQGYSDAQKEFSDKMIDEINKDKEE